MKTTYGIGTAALLALVLTGISSRAQEPAPAAGGDDATVTSAAPPPATVSANSKVRIVRLSESKGEVQLDRMTGKGFEGAMANLPIIEGAKLKTGTGVAEVEFEDNSTVRVAPNSMIEFTQLELTPSGAKVSGINVLQGMVYVSLMNTKGNEFTVTAGTEKINLPPDSHVRLQLTKDQAQLAVMHGDVMVQGEGAPTQVGKNKTMSFSLAGQSEPVIAKNVTDDQLDDWDHQAVQYHKNYANATSYGGLPYSYGVNDMNYYGSFGSGCGMSMWRPYFASASWDPYSSGAWAYYQNTGYSWVSPYPWGWTPYHYGSWAFCPGVGWGWQPGGAWMGLANNSFTSVPTRPHPPAYAPQHPLQSSLVPVNLKAAPVSGLGKNDTFVFRNGSAGLGVPRGTMGNLSHFSGQTQQRGEATTNVYYAAQHGASGGPGSATMVGKSQGGSRVGSNASSHSVGSASSGGYSSGGGTLGGSSGAGGGHMSSGSGGGAGGHH